MFCAFSHIDANPHRNVRLALEASWDETKVEGVFSTWEDESKFVLLTGCYIAIL